MLLAVRDNCLVVSPMQAAKEVLLKGKAKDRMLELEQKMAVK